MSTGFAKTCPNAVVSPGLIAMPCIATVPACETVCTVESRKPTPVPPIVMRASPVSVESICRREPPTLCMGTICPVAPAAFSAGAIIGATASAISSIAGFAATTVTIGLRTSTRVMPAPRRAPMSIARKISPARRSGCPGAASLQPEWRPRRAMPAQSPRACFRSLSVLRTATPHRRMRATADRSRPTQHAAMAPARRGRRRRPDPRKPPSRRGALLVSREAPLDGDIGRKDTAERAPQYRPSLAWPAPATRSTAA